MAPGPTTGLVDLNEEKAKSIACINSLRQMGIATKIYSDDHEGRFCFTFQVRGNNVFRKAWFNFLQPYQQTTNLLLCPGKTKKFKELVALYPSELADTDTTGHFGGTLNLLNGETAVTFVPAWHGAGVETDENSAPIYGGTPSGLVIAIRNGPTIYHTGDTDLFSDMALVSQFNKIDIMLVCIGDHFTMGPARAAEAVKLVDPRTVIPMHYGTFPVLTGTPEAFNHELKQRNLKAELRVMNIGETITLERS